jgi:hypothetical protein
VWHLSTDRTLLKPVSMAERSKASSIRPLEHWDRRLESCSGHGCLSASSCVVLSWGGRGLALD